MLSRTPLPPPPPPSRPGGKPPRLLDELRRQIRLRHYSYRTEQAYVGWVRRYILFHNKRHPSQLGAPEVESFLSHLASVRNVASATQAQAMAALRTRAQTRAPTRARARRRTRAA